MLYQCCIDRSNIGDVSRVRGGGGGCIRNWSAAGDAIGAQNIPRHTPTLNHCSLNVGLASQTMGQLWANNGSASRLRCGYPTDRNSGSRAHIAIPANTIHWPNVGLLVAQRRRQWVSIKPTPVNVSCLLVAMVLFLGDRSARRMRMSSPAVTYDLSHSCGHVPETVAQCCYSVYDTDQHYNNSGQTSPLRHMRFHHIVNDTSATSTQEGVFSFQILIF